MIRLRIERDAPQSRLYGLLGALVRDHGVTGYFDRPRGLVVLQGTPDALRFAAGTLYAHKVVVSVDHEDGGWGAVDAVA